MKIWFSKARIVLLGAILASLSLNAAVTDVNITSTTGTTNIIRLFIVGSVTNGNLLLVQGTNVIGISTNNFIFTNSGVTLASFDTNQFRTNLNKISIKDGVIVTNFHDAGTSGLYALLVTNNVGFGGDLSVDGNTLMSGFLQVNGPITNNGVRVLTNIPPNGLASTLVKWVTTNLQSYIVNGVGMLTNDGNGNFGFTTNIAQDVTINNINSTNTTTINNTTTSNLFYISGKGNVLILTNTLQLLNLASSVLMVDGSGNVTNVSLGTGLTLTGRTLFPTNIVENQLNLTDVTTGDASISKHGFLPKLTNDVTKFLNGIGTYSVPGGGGGGSIYFNGTSVTNANIKDSAWTVWDTVNTTNLSSRPVATVTALTWSTTNLVGMDLAASKVFSITLTNHAFIGASTLSNLPTTNQYGEWVLMVREDSTGGYYLNFTNSIFAWPEGYQPVKITNAYAIDYYYFHTDLSTNSTLVGNMNQQVHR